MGSRTAHSSEPSTAPRAERTARAADRASPVKARGGALPWLLCIPAIGAVVLLFTAMAAGRLGAGPLAQQMAAHILLMDAAAPLLALCLLGSAAAAGARSIACRSLALPTVLQLALLWIWHSPAAMSLATASHGGHLAMQSTLFAAAMWFWLAVLGLQGADRWRSILALLVTGKLFCLLGAILVFSPRLLYPAAGHAHDVLTHEQALADQHLAGLLMLAACPISYVLAGLIIAARWVGGLAPGDGDAQAARYGHG